MNPVCCQCDVEMRCKKNGITVAPESIPQHKRSGDKYSCPSCGVSIITGFSYPFTDNNTEPNVYLKGE
jgi:hypothetical protein